MLFVKTAKKSSFNLLQGVSLLLLAVGCVCGVPVVEDSEVVWTEDFESDPPEYVTSVPEFSDGFEDFFTRTDGSSNIGSSIVFTGFSGTFFAAMDLDGEGASSEQSIEWSGIDIAGKADLVFCGKFAEDADGSNFDWDSSDFVHVDYGIDGGAMQPLLYFESVPDGDSFNHPAAVDTNFDGDGDGTQLTDDSQLFCASIAGTGSSLTIKITMELDSGDEDIAFDDLFVCAGVGCEIEEEVPTAAPTATTLPPVSKIHEIQGAGEESPLVGDLVMVEAVVVGDFQNSDADESRNLGGFFLQEEDVDADSDPLTSEGIFVFDSSSSETTMDVNVGDLVRVVGEVSEFFGETQISGLQLVEVLDTSVVLPSPAVISLPTTATTLSQDGDIQPDLEAYEGMLVTFEDQLIISEMFQLDRFNEIKLVQGERPFQFSQLNEPNVDGYQLHLQDVGSRTITYDDGLQLQNALICNLDGFSDGTCVEGSFNTATDIRMGDTIDNLSGVLYYKWAGNSASQATWRVSSVEDGTNVFGKANQRPSSPPHVGGKYTIASVNVLNFFKTIDESGAGSGPNNLDPRGADNTAEFERQEEKLVRALVEMDADVFGLVELENDFAPETSGNAIERLVDQMNAYVGDVAAYSWIDPGQQYVDSGDAISNGFIYKTSSVRKLVGQPAILRDQDLPALGIDVPEAGIFDGLSTNRASFAAGLKFNTGGCVLLSVNHFKSKGSENGGAGNADAGNGAGRNNAIRLLAAEAVSAWLDSDPIGRKCKRKVILGDLNSYAKEDPITFLESVGYTDVERAFNGDEAYSFVFDGQIGTLDYVLVNDKLLRKVTGAATWKINADEPDALDYNLDFGRDGLIFDGTSPLRFSDHDALLVGIDLGRRRHVFESIVGHIP